jgi:hypothetical protein
MQKLKIYSFEDLVFKPHQVVPGGKSAFLELPNLTSASVVGGGVGSSLYGNGETTFEVWYSDEDDPRSHQTIEEINRELGERSIRQLGLL